MSAAWTRACSFSSDARSPSSLTRLLAHLRRARRACRPAPRRAGRARPRAGSRRPRSGRAREDALGGELLLLLEVGELDGLVLRLVAQPAHAVGDLAVLVRDPLEELGALEQVAEAVGLQDHGDDVGRVGLVDLDEPVGQHVARGGELATEPLEAVARLLEPVADLEQLRLLAVQVRLHAREPALRGRDLALHGVDAGAEALDRRAEYALLRLVPLDLVALLLDARGQRSRQTRQREHQERRHGKGDGKQKAFLHYGWSATGFPTFTCVMQGFSALATAPL